MMTIFNISWFIDSWTRTRSTKWGKKVYVLFLQNFYRWQVWFANFKWQGKKIQLTKWEIKIDPELLESVWKNSTLNFPEGITFFTKMSSLRVNFSSSFSCRHFVYNNEYILDKNGTAQTSHNQLWLRCMFKLLPLYGCCTKLDESCTFCFSRKVFLFFIFFFQKYFTAASVMIRENDWINYHI